MKLPILSRALVLTFLISGCLGSLWGEEPKGVPPLKVVYFTPKDREAPADRQERLGRVMKNIQEFYRKGMEDRGCGSLTFALEWDAPDKLKIYDVQGKDNLSGYPKGTEGKVYGEVRQALAAEGIDIEKEYVLVLGAFVEWKEDKTAVEYGPYSGGGNGFSGRASACDDHLIDSELLGSKDSGGFHYMVGPCSLGKYNTLYVGGIAHELGHCFSLPHDCELDSQRSTLGYSLMGIGNHHYGEDLRGEGPGAFLTESSAIRLSATRAFNPDFAKQFRPNVNYSITKLKAAYKDGVLTVDGRISSDPPLVGIVAYNDNMKINSDYDAKTWVSKPDEDGNFHLEITEIARAPYQLRLASILPGGAIVFNADYSNESGIPNLSAINSGFEMIPINDLLGSKKYDELEAVLKEYIETEPQNKRWPRMLKHVATLKSPPPFYEPAEVNDDQKSADLTWAKTTHEKVGYYEPSRAILREYGFMQVGKTFFASGIYAHAYSNYTFQLGRKWKELEFSYGLQDGKPGSVVFVVLGDGKELFRSKTVKASELWKMKVDISGVDKLQLITEDAGDDSANDWGLWLEPTLLR